ncbi:MAG: hypothetical protein M1831_006605 [Alyxoria varia]|nr:MAG: hypothetical protein M1831_006605 [Alyxoria varia]
MQQVEALPIRNVSALYRRASKVYISLRRPLGNLSSARAYTAQDPLQPRERNVGQDGRPSASEEARSTKDEAKKDGGAMTRLLQHMSESNLEQNGQSAQNAIKEAGFPEKLKDELLERIAASDSGGTSMRNQFPSAFAEAGLSASAGQGTKDIAGAAPWTGNESIPDAALRMLNDSYKPLRQPSKIPVPQKPPRRVDTGRPRKEKGAGSASSGSRLASARDRSSMYSYLRDSSLSEQEKEEMRKELKDRFKAGARPMPTTIQGLSSLANERIEDAIARGQFKNLPRGKQIERDHNMSSPFLDTTEYFMNKIIQKQEIVPPWIEKQQEVVNETARFRGRLRAEWRRHAARVLASQGGSLEAQLKRAGDYAKAETAWNPLAKLKSKDQPIGIANEDYLSQISPSGELKVPPTGNNNSEPSVAPDSANKPATEDIAAAPNQASDSLFVHEEQKVQDLEDVRELQELLSIATDELQSTEQQQQQQQEQQPAQSTQDTRETMNSPPTSAPPFRDPTWITHEYSYHTTAISSLNGLIRSYNLMAPELAKKPYLNLDRELNACYADVAPTLASEIRERALAPKARLDGIAESERTGVGGGIFGSARGGIKVWDEKRERRYGFKEFVRDVAGSLWKDGDDGKGRDRKAE